MSPDAQTVPATEGEAAAIALRHAHIARSVPRVSTINAEEIAHANRASTQTLLALSATGKHIYPGTIGGAEKARRRAQGKRTRLARRSHR